MSSQGGISGVAVTAAGVGVVLAYSAIKGKNVSQSFRALLAGQNPSLVPSDPNLAISGGGTTGSATGAAGLVGDVPVGNSTSIDPYLKGTLGFTRAGRAGALGNMQVESGFSPTAGNAAEGAIGICQWELGRRTNLQTYAAAHGLHETDLAAQLGYMRLELLTGYADVYAYMRLASDPGAAAAYWDANYEHSAGTTRQARISNALAIYGSLT